MGRGQSEWGEHHWPECYICGNVKALGYFVFSVTWGDSLDVTVTHCTLQFMLMLIFMFCQERNTVVFEFLCEGLGVAYSSNLNAKYIFFSEGKHYFKGMDHPAEEMIFRTVEFTCLVWLLGGMKSTEGQWVAMLHSSEWHIRDLSAFGACKDALWAVRSFIVHQG